MYKYMYIYNDILANIEVVHVINTLNQPNIHYWELIANVESIKNLCI